MPFGVVSWLGWLALSHHHLGEFELGFATVGGGHIRPAAWRLLKIDVTRSRWHWPRHGPAVGYGRDACAG